MSLNESGMSPADFAAISGRNNDMLGGGNGVWWIIILFLFAFCGWGGGWSNGGTSGAADNYVLASDFAQVERKIDTVNNGLCDGFYSQAQLTNGVQMSIASQGYDTKNAITQAQIAEMQNANAIQSQIANCCCTTKEAIAGVNYNMAMNTNTLQSAVNTGFCQTNYNNQNNTRDIIESQNASTRAILDALNAQKTEALKDRIMEQNQQISALQLAASQAAQNDYLISQLKQCPIPAYTVPNPYTGCCNSCGC